MSPLSAPGPSTGSARRRCQYVLAKQTVNTLTARPWDQSYCVRHPHFQTVGSLKVRVGSPSAHLGPRQVTEEKTEARGGRGPAPASQPHPSSSFQAPLLPGHCPPNIVASPGSVLDLPMQPSLPGWPQARSWWPRSSRVPLRAQAQPVQVTPCPFLPMSLLGPGHQHPARLLRPQIPPSSSTLSTPAGKGGGGQPPGLPLCPQKVSPLCPLLATSPGQAPLLTGPVAHHGLQPLQPVHTAARRVLLRAALRPPLLLKVFLGFPTAPRTEAKLLAGTRSFHEVEASPPPAPGAQPSSCSPPTSISLPLATGTVNPRWLQIRHRLLQEACPEPQASLQHPTAPPCSPAPRGIPLKSHHSHPQGPNWPCWSL